MGKGIKKLTEEHGRSRPRKLNIEYRTYPKTSQVLKVKDLNKFSKSSIECQQLIQMLNSSIDQEKISAVDNSLNDLLIENTRRFPRIAGKKSNEDRERLYLTRMKLRNLKNDLNCSRLPNLNNEPLSVYLTTHKLPKNIQNSSRTLTHRTKPLKKCSTLPEILTNTSDVLFPSQSEQSETINLSSQISPSANPNLDEISHNFNDISQNMVAVVESAIIHELVQEMDFPFTNMHKETSPSNFHLNSVDKTQCKDGKLDVKFVEYKKKTSENFNNSTCQQKRKTRKRTQHHSSTDSKPKMCFTKTKNSQFTVSSNAPLTKSYAQRKIDTLFKNVKSLPAESTRKKVFPKSDVLVQKPSNSEENPNNFQTTTMIEKENVNISNSLKTSFHTQIVNTGKNMKEVKSPIDEKLNFPNTSKVGIVKKLCKSHSITKSVQKGNAQCNLQKSLINTLRASNKKKKTSKSQPLPIKLTSVKKQKKILHDLPTSAINHRPNSKNILDNLSANIRKVNHARNSVEKLNDNKNQSCWSLSSKRNPIKMRKSRKCLKSVKNIEQIDTNSNSSENKRLKSDVDCRSNSLNVLYNLPVDSLCVSTSEELNDDSFPLKGSLLSNKQNEIEIRTSEKCLKNVETLQMSTDYNIIENGHCQIQPECNGEIDKLMTKITNFSLPLNESSNKCNDIYTESTMCELQPRDNVQHTYRKTNILREMNKPIEKIKSLPSSQSIERPNKCNDFCINSSISESQSHDKVQDTNPKANFDEEMNQLMEEIINIPLPPIETPNRCNDTYIQSQISDSLDQIQNTNLKTDDCGESADSTINLSSQRILRSSKQPKFVNLKQSDSQGRKSEIDILINDLNNFPLQYKKTSLNNVRSNAIAPKSQSKIINFHNRSPKLNNFYQYQNNPNTTNNTRDPTKSPKSGYVISKRSPDNTQNIKNTNKLSNVPPHMENSVNEKLHENSNIILTSTEITFPEGIKSGTEIYESAAVLTKSCQNYECATNSGKKTNSYNILNFSIYENQSPLQQVAAPSFVENRSITNITREQIVSVDNLCNKFSKMMIQPKCNQDSLQNEHFNQSWQHSQIKGTFSESQSSTFLSFSDLANLNSTVTPIYHNYSQILDVSSILKSVSNIERRIPYYVPVVDNWYENFDDW